MKLSMVGIVGLLVATNHHAHAFVPLPNTRTTSPSSCLLFLEPLAKEGEWTAYLDEDSTGLVYYFNGKTGESLWEPPTSTFPKVQMSRETKRVARKKQRQYKRQEKEKNEGGGFFSSVLSVVAEDNKEDVKQEERKSKQPKQEKEESPDWFEGITIDTIASQSKAAEKVVETKTQDTQEEEGPSLMEIFWSSKPDETKLDEAPINGDVATKQEEPSTGLFDLFGKKDGTDVMEEPKVTTKEPDEGKGFGLKSVMNVFQRGDAEIVPRQAIEIDVASYVLPHPAKTSWGGEDAAFVKGRTFGVFDGVSGADKLDGVPLYSKTLAKELQLLVSEEDGLNTKELSSALLEAAEFADKAATGASTAVVASITKDGYLRAVNLGDSVCLLIRNNMVRAKTREIVHYFECPYQLAEDSPDRPKDATTLNIEVLPGDTIVMGSDGVFDNLGDKVLCDVVASAAPRERAYTTAKRISDLSRKVSLDKKADTPYAKAAKQNGDPDYTSGKGGKVDDISCVLVRCS